MDDSHLQWALTNDEGLKRDKMTDSDSWEKWRRDSILQALAKGWIEPTESRTSLSEEPITKLIYDDPEQAFALILASIQLIDDDSLLYSFAAGPLEDFLGVHGEAFIHRIQTLAVQHRRLRLALGGVWQGAMNKGLWRRVEALTERPHEIRETDMTKQEPMVMRCQFVLRNIAP